MTQQHEEPKQAEPKAEKKPYVAPKLVHLGSVSDLTGGASGHSQDGFAGGKALP